MFVKLFQSFKSWLFIDTKRVELTPKERKQKKGRVEDNNKRIRRKKKINKRKKQHIKKLFLVTLKEIEWGEWMMVIRSFSCNDW